jgi:hypothetical protein
MEIERYEPGRSPGRLIVRITCGGDPGNARVTDEAPTPSVRGDRAGTGSGVTHLYRGSDSLCRHHGGSAAEPALGTSVLQSCRVLSLMMSTRSCANTATMPNSARPMRGRGIDIGLGQAIDVPATVVQLVDGLDGLHRHTSQPIKHTDDEGFSKQHANVPDCTAGGVRA